MTEIIVATTITVLVTLMVIPAMASYARTIKGVRNQQLMQQRANLFLQRLEIELTQANRVALPDDDTVRITGARGRFVVDTDSPTGQRYVTETIITTLQYTDEDDDPDTIEDNFLTEFRRVLDTNGNIIEESERVVLRWVSPVIVDGEDQAIFTLMDTATAGSRRDYVEMLLQVGDRENPSSPEWDALTGAGYQGVTVRTILSPSNLPGLGGS